MRSVRVRLKLELLGACTIGRKARRSVKATHDSNSARHRRHVGCSGRKLRRKGGLLSRGGNCPTLCLGCPTRRPQACPGPSHRVTSARPLHSAHYAPARPSAPHSQDGSPARFNYPTRLCSLDPGN